MSLSLVLILDGEMDKYEVLFDKYYDETRRSKSHFLTSATHVLFCNGFT